MIPYESLKFLDDLLMDLDEKGLLGQCDDHMADDGPYCKMCTALKDLATEVERLK